MLQDEGGYSCVPGDPGGETNFGISKRAYPNLDIAKLTRDETIAIYWRDWWHRYGFDRIQNEAIGAKLFDLAVDIGADHAIKCLQRALRAYGVDGIVEDGILGTVTFSKTNSCTNWMALLVGLRCEAAGYYRTLALERGRRKDGDHEFLEGWLNRAYE